VRFGLADVCDGIADRWRPRAGVNDGGSVPS